MRLCSIASGSSGNCIYVGSDSTHVLIDAGISGKRITNGLSELDILPSEISGILITHEHTDHTAGIGVMARKYGIPIYATRKTIKVICQTTSIGAIDESLFCEIKPDKVFSIKDIIIDPMHTSHDAVDPVAYRLNCGTKKVAIITDLGCFDEYTVNCLQDLDAVLVEANHDIKMLEVGPYPYYLKQRILGERGHLSNECAGQLISKILHAGMKHVVLGHLSKENNMAELAFETVRIEINTADNIYRGNDFPILVANRSTNSAIIEI